jgi:hypothetical protein
MISSNDEDASPPCRERLKAFSSTAEGDLSHPENTARMQNVARKYMT